MPGVGVRACSSRTKEFQAASSGRGRRVTTTVSSTSQTTPVRAASAMMRTSAAAGCAPSACRVTRRQPGSSSTAMTVSTIPPRSATTSKVRPPAVMVTSAKGTGAEMKLRHPRKPSAMSLVTRRPLTKCESGAITTREKTRTQCWVP